MPLRPHNIAQFSSAQKLRNWLEKHHATASELWIELRRTTATHVGVTYAEALDEALCFGWIDGVRYPLDAHRYTIRFTPRKARSIWSLVNVRHVERLKKARRMSPAGLAAFAAREKRRTGVYSFEQKQRNRGLSAKYKKVFRANGKAWKFFSQQAPWYRRTTGYWVSSAKHEETRQRRLAKLIADSAKGRRIGQLVPKNKRAAP